MSPAAVCRGQREGAWAQIADPLAVDCRQLRRKARAERAMRRQMGEYHMVNRPPTMDNYALSLFRATLSLD